MGGRGASGATAGARTGRPSKSLPARANSAWSALGEAPAGYTSGIERFERDGSSLEVSGIIRTSSGSFAGEFGMTLHHEGGQLIAKTDNLLLEPGHQGKGIGAAVARNMDETYRRLGVSEVRLHAAQVGRYVWAKQGYDYDAATGRSMAEHYGRWLSANGHDAGEASVALKGARALADSPHGKAFLLSDAPNWNGTRRLS